MALKAGYYGVKKSLIGAINSLLSAKIIKSIGDGLDLTPEGELGVKVGENLEVDEDGNLNCTASGGKTYSTSEFDTGDKWIGGKTIYGKVIFPNSYDFNPNLSGATRIIEAKGGIFAYDDRLYPIPNIGLDNSLNIDNTVTTAFSVLETDRIMVRLGSGVSGHATSGKWFVILFYIK